MTRALFWKEFRQQRNVWLAIFLLAALVACTPLVAALLKAEAHNVQRLIGAGFPAALILCPTYGLCCATLLLAGEREEETLTFLDTLPGGRRQLWVIKFWAGVSLLGAQLLAQLAVLAAVGVLRQP